MADAPKVPIEKVEGKPSDDQLPFLHLTLEEFRTQTNVIESIRTDYFNSKKKAIKEQNIPKLVEWYYDCLSHVRYWHQYFVLENLKFIPEKKKMNPKSKNSSAKAHPMIEPASTSRKKENKKPAIADMEDKKNRKRQLDERAKPPPAPKKGRTVKASVVQPENTVQNWQASNSRNTPASASAKPTNASVARNDEESDDHPDKPSTSAKVPPIATEKLSAKTVAASASSNTSRASDDVANTNQSTNSMDETELFRLENHRPNHFQGVVKEMTLEDFERETNIGDLVRHHLQDQTGRVRVKRSLLNFGIKYYFDLRGESEKWGRCLLRELKHHVRNAKTQKNDKPKDMQVSSTQTEHTALMQNISTQTEPIASMPSTLKVPISTQTNLRPAFDEIRVSQLPDESQAPIHSMFDPLQSQAAMPMDGDQTSMPEVPLNITDAGHEPIAQSQNETQFDSQRENLSNEDFTEIVAKQEPLSISQVNAKYGSEVVMENVPNPEITVNESQNSQQLFDEAMNATDSQTATPSSGIPSQGEWTNVTITTINTQALASDTDQNRVQSIVLAARMDPNAGSLEQMITSNVKREPLTADEVNAKYQEDLVCVDDASTALNITIDDSESEKTQNLLNVMMEPTENASAVPSSSVQETASNDVVIPQNPSQASTNTVKSMKRFNKPCPLSKKQRIQTDDDNENVNPQQSTNNNSNKMPNNPDVQSSVRERFSNMKVKPYPSYYDGPSNKANLAKQKQRVSLTQRHHNWEMANNPQIVPVPGEFDIEDASQPSQPSSTVDNILNTDNSVFLSSQLLSGGHQDVDGGEVIVNETPEESNVDDNTQSDEFIAPTPPSIDIAPPPKRRRTISADEPIIVATDNDSYVPVTPVTPTNDTASNQQNAIVATASTSAEHAFGSIFKIPTTPLNVTYLQSINIENVSYRFHVNQRPRDIHHNICHQQEELCTILGFKCDGIHNVQLNGENTRKILKFKSTEWRSVQAILDAVKEFTYNAYTRLPPKATLFERSLHCLFASTSKFSNVHIQRVQYNEANNTDECSVLDTVYSLKWAPLCLQWTVDPYILKEAQFKTRQLEPSPSSEAE